MTPKNGMHLGVSDAVYRQWEALNAKCYELSVPAINYAFEQRAKLVEKYVWCSKNGHWPGYDGGIEVVLLPNWLKTNETFGDF